MTDRLKKFFEFVKEQHDAVEQKRKYTLEPYWTHTLAVAERVAQFDDSETTFAAALGHDLIEDTDCTVELLRTEARNAGFSPLEAALIVALVVELTDVYTKEACPDLNRKTRKALEAERLGTTSPTAQTIKYADLEDNTKSITEHDKDFSIVYLKEKLQLLNCMRQGHLELLTACYLSVKSLQKPK